MTALHFELPRDLEAAEPPPVRDEVRLMVAQPGDAARPHRASSTSPTTCARGDLLVVNASATLPAALPARRADGGAVDLHLSTPDPVEPRRAGSWRCAATAAAPAHGPRRSRCPRGGDARRCSRRT